MTWSPGQPFLFWSLSHAYSAATPGYNLRRANAAQTEVLYLQQFDTNIRRYCLMSFNSKDFFSVVKSELERVGRCMSEE